MMLSALFELMCSCQILATIMNQSMNFMLQMVLPHDHFQHYSHLVLSEAFKHFIKYANVVKFKWRFV